MPVKGIPVPENLPSPINLARKVLQQFPKTSSHALGRLLHQRYPETFLTIENARCTVRRARGAQGDPKKNRTIPTHKRSTEESNLCLRWGFVPLPEPNPWTTHKLPSGVNRWLILADLHIPYHDLQAVTVALDYGRQTKCDGVLLLGDVPDCYQLSRFLPDPRQRRFAEETQAVRQFLDGLAKAFKTIVWRGGNHEMRLERYLMRRAPELFGIPEFSYEGFLKLKEHGILWVPPMNPIVVGRLTILHGHEWPVGTTTPVNPARTAYLKATSCVLVAHQHRTSEHTEQTLDGTTITCWSVGCLADLHPLWRPVANKWNHGFAVLDLTGDSWRIDNRRIVQGKVV